MSERRHDERRGAERYQLAFNLEPVDVRTGRPMGWLIDISPVGMMLASESPRRVEGRYRLRLDLPVEIDGYRSIDVEATAAWTKPAMDPSFHRTGFRELQLVSGPPRALERLIEDHHLPPI